VRGRSPPVCLCEFTPIHDMSCHVMSCHVMSCHVMSCHVMSCQCHVRARPGTASARHVHRRVARISPDMSCGVRGAHPEQLRWAARSPARVCSNIILVMCRLRSILVCGANALCVDPPRGSNLGTPGVAPDTVFPPDSSMGGTPLSVSTLNTVSGAHGASALETAHVSTRRRLMWSRGTADTSP
jgi:hypothetical protein